MTYLLLVAGLALLLGGGEFLVRGSVGFARALGLSPLFIGLTLVGFGTSAPELVASLIAAFREAPGIAVGNVVGSNIYNILGILGLTALVHPLSVPPEIAGFDIWILLATAVALLYFMLGGRTLGRLWGGAFLVAYAGYLLALLA